MQAQGSGDFKLSQQSDGPVNMEVTRSSDESEAGLTGGVEGRMIERQHEPAAAVEKTLSQSLIPPYLVSGGQAEHKSQAGAAEKLGFPHGGQHSVAQNSAAEAPVAKKQGSQQSPGSRDPGRAPHVTPAEGVAASLEEHSHAAHSQGSHLYSSQPHPQTATTANAAERKEDSMQEHEASMVTQNLHQNSGKGAIEERELPAVKKLPPWFKESSEDAEEVHSPTHPFHTFASSSDKPVISLAPASA